MDEYKWLSIYVLMWITWIWKTFVLSAILSRFISISGDKLLAEHRLKLKIEKQFTAPIFMKSNKESTVELTTIILPCHKLKTILHSQQNEISYKEIMHFQNLNQQPLTDGIEDI